MTSPILFAFALALGAASTGCYSYGLAKPVQAPIDALAAPPAGVGEVCVFRPHWLASAVTFVVRDNGHLVGATRGPSYFCYYAQPGKHVLTSEADDVEQATFTIEAGGRYYLHQIVDNIAGFVRSRLTWIGGSEVSAMRERCAYRVLVQVPAREQLPSSTTIAAAAP